MTTLTDIETAVLYEVEENLTSSYNWDGDDELREAIADAIDEICFIQELHVEKVSVPLLEDTPFYTISIDGFTPLFIKSAYLPEQDRRLDCESLSSLGRQDQRFILESGSPRYYVPITNDLVGFFPYKAADGGIVRLTIVCVPDHYSYADGYVSIREEFEEALIRYGKYYLMMRSGRHFDRAIEEFTAYLEMASPISLLKHHKRAVQKHRYRNFMTRQ